jgi:hypothetical protein
VTVFRAADNVVHDGKERRARLRSPARAAPRAALKPQWREEDARALASGEKTAQQFRDENEVFAKLAPLARVDLIAPLTAGRPVVLVGPQAAALWTNYLGVGKASALRRSTGEQGYRLRRQCARRL